MWCDGISMVCFEIEHHTPARAGIAKFGRAGIEKL